MSAAREESFTKISNRLFNISSAPEGVFVGALEALSRWAESEGLIEDSQEWFTEALELAGVEDIEDEDEDDEDLGPEEDDDEDE